MNRENIEYCIELMRNAKNLNMLNWQGVGNTNSPIIKDHVLSIDDLHACGNTACFAGYVALSPKFQNESGYIECGGMPVFRDNTFTIWSGAGAIAAWLGISTDQARLLVYGTIGQFYLQLGWDESAIPVTVEDDEGDKFCKFYQKKWADVTADDVIEKLQQLLTGESENWFDELQGG